MKKSFVVGGATEPVEFDLVGTNVDGTPIEPILFRCLPQMQGQAQFQMLGSTKATGDEVTDFICDALREEEVPRFMEIITGKTVIVQADTLADIMLWLGEVYSQRPFDPYAASANGPSTTPTTSTASVTGAAVPDPGNSLSTNSAMPSTP